MGSDPTNAAGDIIASFDLAGKDALCLRLAPSSPDLWQPIGGVETLVLDDLATPSRPFAKEVIRIGDYVKVSANQEFSVTMAALENWVTQFAAMKSNGRRVPIPDGHDNYGKAGANLGWVDSLWIEGESLWMACTIIGEDAMRTVARSDVSLFSPPRFTDSDGITYVRPIRHVAACTDQVVTGLRDFIPLEASFRLKGENMTLEKLKEIAASLGLDPETIVDEAAGVDTVLDKVCLSLGEWQAEKKKAEAEKVTLTASLATEKAKNADKPPADPIKPKAEPPNAMLVQSLAENRRLKVDALILSGHITPAVRDKLVEQFIGEDDKAVALALSNGSDGSDFNHMIEAFKLNDPITFKSKTGAQVGIRLADDRKGKPAEKTALAKDVDRRVAEAEAAK